MNRTLTAEPLRPDDHVLGPDSAPATVIAYCDFECPYCGRAFAKMKRLRDRFQEQLRFVFRHFPLVDKHPLAQQAAEASEAAAHQGRFWVMHDLLFVHQDDLEIVDLYESPDRAQPANVIVAPTLIRHEPKPVKLLVGDMSDTQRLQTTIMV